MGYLTLVDAIQTLGPKVALELHLSNNFYPPLDPGARECGRKVVGYIERGEYYPLDQLEWRMANDDHGWVSAGRVVEALHLEPFIEYYAEVSREPDRAD